MTWEPQIITFCCNWCSYAGADLAGVSRFQYPPNIRIVRVMCTGRIDPAFVLEAFKTGIDGVLITGCHPGDCHYISGNEKAKLRVESTKRLLGTLGIDPERLGLEWISASEGQKFAKTMTDFVTKIRALGPNKTSIKESSKDKEKKPSGTKAKKVKSGYEYCVECFKCAASCPITRVDPSYSPTKNVCKVSFDPKGEVVSTPEVWNCLTCGTCSQRCPSGVKYEELIRGERSEAFSNHQTYTCAHGEALRTVSDLQTIKDMKQNRMTWISKDLKVAQKGDVQFFVGCTPYFDTTIFCDGTEKEGFKGIGAQTLEISRSTVRLMNRAGIVPIVDPEERCCGHDALWIGDEEKFKKLARLNIDRIKALGAKTVVLSCAEGYRTLKYDYPKYFGKLDFEVIHSTEFFAKLIQDGKLVLRNPQPYLVAYQDPCRLAKHSNITEAPRTILSKIPELKFVDLGLGGRDTTCCGGPNAWANCGKMNRKIQMQKLKEIKESQALTVITACPKCFIHLNCIINSKLPSSLKGLKIKFMDINILLDKATAGGDSK